MSETEQRDKDLHEQANLHKTDPSISEGVRVPRGDDPPSRERIDPFAARMSMFQKADAVRDAQASQGGSLSEAQQQEESRMRAEVEPGAPPADRTLHLRRSTAPSQVSNDRVSLALNGGTISVAKADIDRAGGEAAYLHNRQLDADALELSRRQDGVAQRERELDAALADAARLRAELQQGRDPAGQGGPATSPAGPAGAPRNGVGDLGAEDRRLAEELANQIYGGSAEEATKAVARLLQESRTRGAAVDEASIIARVKAELSGSLPAGEGARPATPAAPAKPKTATALMNERINAMSLSEYPELMKDPVARVASFETFKQLVVLPENKDRLAVDVARDACALIERKFHGNPRGDVIERKRGLAPSTSASGAHSETTEEDVVPTASESIRMMAERRNFGRRSQPT